MPSRNDIQELQAQFLRIVNKYHRLEKVPLDHGAGGALFPAETHTVEAIGGHPGITVTVLAEKQGVTKGAVSQTVAKLARKGLVEKRRSASDAKMIHLHLTDKGRIVVAGHARFHARYDAEAVKALLALDAAGFSVLARFLALTEATLDTYLGDLT